MLFNSPEYIYLFLPTVVICYFYLNQRKHYEAAKLWLVAASLFFYGAWNFHYIPLILISLLVNYRVAIALSDIKKQKTRMWIFYVGILFNVALLFYYKYYNFFIENIDVAFGASISLEKIILPLGISFFTFQKIAYLVDTYKNKVKKNDAVDFCFFVTFFPQLISGPIVHHAEVIPQINDASNKKIIWVNLLAGLILFFIGLFKKVVVADVLGSVVAEGYTLQTYQFFCAWFVSAAYTLQIYFDFSGYTDMALGAALLLNIRLPQNFHSPYKAKDIADFWRRWHITLSRWLRDYIYIPLGGNRSGRARMLLNVFITFVVGGIWHGASWTFVVWGILHGICVVLHKLWQSTRLKLPSWMAAVMLLVCINILWVFFRAESIDKAVSILNGLVNFSSMGSLKDLENLALVINSGLLGTWLTFIHDKNYTVITIVGLVLLLVPFTAFAKNSNEIANDILQSREKITIKLVIFFALIMVLAVYIFMYRNISPSPFIYFNF